MPALFDDKQDLNMAQAPQTGPKSEGFTGFRSKVPVRDESGGDAGLPDGSAF